jgi:hypothetical protein
MGDPALVWQFREAIRLSENLEDVEAAFGGWSISGG